MNQKSHSKANRVAWSDPAYYALWCERYGTPEAVAEEIARDPWYQLKRYRAHLGHVHGKRIVNLLGSIGRKAVPLAILGADVTVVDASPVNERFAEALAESAGVTIRYVVSDVLEMELRDLGEPFDVVLMEGGILGYFVDLAPLAELCFNLARPGGRLVLGGSLVANPTWMRVLDILDTNIDLHIYSVWHWSDLENENDEDSWRVTPFLRDVLERHRRRFENSRGPPRDPDGEAG